MIKFITSHDNKALKLVRSLSQKKQREKNRLYFAEGARISKEAVTYIKDDIDFLLITNEYLSENEEYINGVEKNGICVYATEEKLFREVCDTENPQGIMAVVKIPERDSLDLNADYILILDGVSEPGNMGTIIRTAEAAGIKQICLTEGCADVYNPKTVRASMSSVFRMSFCNIKPTDIDVLKEAGFTVAATVLEDSESIESVKIDGKRAVVIGSEAHGVSKEVAEKAQKRVRIDMFGEIESLNAAVAAGIAMYILRP